MQSKEFDNNNYTTAGEGKKSIQTILKIELIISH